MALNPKTIKALFSKLAPYADDVAKGVANYGDDAVRLIGEYGDDVAEGIVKYGDDVVKIGTNPASRKVVQDVNLNTVFDTFEQPITRVDGVKINDKWFSHPGIELNRRYHDFMDDLNWNAFYGTFEDYVGNNNAFTKADILERILRGDRTYDEPTRIIDPLKRPGANTALGRWYAKQHPTMYDYPIGPNPSYPWDPIENLKNPYMAFATSNRLPF